MKIIYKIFATIKNEGLDKINDYMEGFTGKRDYLSMGAEMAELTLERETDFTGDEEKEFLKGLNEVWWKEMAERSTPEDFAEYQKQFDIVTKRDRTEK